MGEHQGPEHAQPTEKCDIVITRVFDAPVGLVWQAWNDPEYVLQWWGPEGFGCCLAQMDVRVGGTSLVGMSSPAYGTLYSTWDYQEIAPQERIAYIHNLADQDGQIVDPAALGMPPDFPQDQQHVVIFRALDDGRTELTITEYDWPMGEMTEMSRMGMEQCLDKMAAAISRQARSSAQEDEEQ